MFDNYKDTQKIAYNILSNSIKNNKISHAYLIESKGNEKSYDFALSFAKALLCPKKLTNNKNCIGSNSSNVSLSFPTNVANNPCIPPPLVCVLYAKAPVHIINNIIIKNNIFLIIFDFFFFFFK